MLQLMFQLKLSKIEFKKIETRRCGSDWPYFQVQMSVSFTYAVLRCVLL